MERSSCTLRLFGVQRGCSLHAAVLAGSILPSSLARPRPPAWVSCAYNELSGANPQPGVKGFAGHFTSTEWGSQSRKVSSKEPAEAHSSPTEILPAVESAPQRDESGEYREVLCPRYVFW